MPINNGILVSADKVYINSNSTPVMVPISSKVYEVPSRAAKVVQIAKRHLHEGTLSGLLVETSDNTTAAEWAGKLLNLIENQGEYDTVALVTPHFYFPDVVIPEGYSLNPILGVAAFDISIPFIALEE